MDASHRANAMCANTKISNHLFFRAVGREPDLCESQRSWLYCLAAPVGVRELVEPCPLLDDGRLLVD